MWKTWKTAHELELESQTGVKRLSPEEAPEASKVLGIASTDRGDELVLRMLKQLMVTAGCPMDLVTDARTPLEVGEAVSQRAPRLVVLSYLPPVGLSSARYLVRKVRAQNPDLRILVGRWGEGGRSSSSEERLISAGASRVLTSLRECRMKLLEEIRSGAKATPVTAGEATAP